MTQDRDESQEPHDASGESFRRGQTRSGPIFST